MSKFLSNRNNLFAEKQEARFLQAIDAGVAALAKSTHSETAVFNTFAKELQILG